MLLRVVGLSLVRTAAQRFCSDFPAARRLPWLSSVSLPSRHDTYSSSSLSDGCPAWGSQSLPLTRTFQRSLVEVKFRKASNTDTSKIPFKVMRTPSGNLPVYSRIRKHGTAVTTIIRHAMGDISALKKDLLSICESPVRERAGSLEVKGLHVLKIKQWLTHLGF